ncbi:hypothetical protein QBC34DRAFT_462576 [Podospora aff. communis PSN243]|uniref:Uncharacterized protein n=1 Tax=Podospora aff. communis PSN243 TaxID=3040156 RepID=A0AAV9GNU7_9PEZI|nr:hypothetical protein QBC34DRAFT_462576 [Podospora aff. communis PSN243]
MPMPQPQILPQGPSLRLSTQHERLILELLPFKDVVQFHEWLNSIYVRGSWYEFSRDFLSRNPLAPEPDKAKLAQQAKDAINSRNQKYLMYHPEKDNWTSEDHHIRFLVTVISDNLLKGLWSESDWKKRNIDIAKSCYEVLSFLRATAGPGVSDNPPRYDG